MKLFTDYQMAIISFCAAECARVNAGEVAVAGMLAAYNYAAQRFAVEQTILQEDIDTMTEPLANSDKAKVLVDSILFNVKNGTLFCPVTPKEIAA
jgi:hypothetical protein